MASIGCAGARVRVWVRPAQSPSRRTHSRCAAIPMSHYCQMRNPMDEVMRGTHADLGDPTAARPASDASRSPAPATSPPLARRPHYDGPPRMPVPRRSGNRPGHRAHRHNARPYTVVAPATTGATGSRSETASVWARLWEPGYLLSPTWRRPQTFAEIAVKIACYRIALMVFLGAYLCFLSSFGPADDIVIGPAIPATPPAATNPVPGTQLGTQPGTAPAPGSPVLDLTP